MREAIPPNVVVLAENEHGQPLEGAANVVCLANVKPESVSWLWPDRVPFGKITLLDGDPGLGKSTVTMDFAARVSTGEPMPGEVERREPAGVVIVSLEDGLADTIAARLAAAGAEMARVHAITGIGPSDIVPSMPEHLPEIERVIEERGARLVVLDPLMALLSGKADAHKDQDVRRALAPLKGVAERTGAAIVVVRHLNKNTGAQAIYRGGGSVGISGAARSVLLVAKDPDDEESRVLASVKSNLGPTPQSIRLSLVSKPNCSCAVVAWGSTCSRTADDLLAPGARENSRDADARTRAEQLIRELLVDGPKPARLVYDAAREVGVSKSTLKRAANSLGIENKKLGFKEGWGWALHESEAGGAGAGDVSSSGEGSPAAQPVSPSANEPPIAVEEPTSEALTPADSSGEEGEL